MKPFVILILLATGRAVPAAMPGVDSAAEDALAPNAVVLVRHVTSATDAEALLMRDAAHADAVAVVSWPDATHAHLHVLTGTSARWLERDLEFSDVDAPMERGRFVGFALGAMFPPRHAAPAAAPPAPSFIPGAPASPDVPKPDRRAAFDLVALASTGIGGYAGGVGSEGSVRLRVATSLEIRAGFGVRIGAIDPLHAQLTAYKLDAGAALRLWRENGARPLELVLRVDGIAMQEVLSRPIDGDAFSRGARWIAGMDALGEGDWAFVPEAAMVAAVGTEVVFGTTRVILDDIGRATIPKVRLVGELGVRVRF